MAFWAALARFALALFESGQVTLGMLKTSQRSVNTVSANMSGLGADPVHADTATVPGNA